MGGIYITQGPRLSVSKIGAWLYPSEWNRCLCLPRIWKQTPPDRRKTISTHTQRDNVTNGKKGDPPKQGISFDRIGRLYLMWSMLDKRERERLFFLFVDVVHRFLLLFSPYYDDTVADLLTHHTPIRPSPSPSRSLILGGFFFSFYKTWGEKIYLCWRYWCSASLKNTTLWALSNDGERFSHLYTHIIGWCNINLLLLYTAIAGRFVGHLKWETLRLQQVRSIGKINI